MSDSPFNYREYLAEHPELYEQLNLKNTTEDNWINLLSNYASSSQNQNNQQNCWQVGPTGPTGPTGCPGQDGPVGPAGPDGCVNFNFVPIYTTESCVKVDLRESSDINYVVYTPAKQGKQLSVDILHDDSCIGKKGNVLVVHWDEFDVSKLVTVPNLEIVAENKFLCRNAKNDVDYCYEVGSKTIENLNDDDQSNDLRCVVFQNDIKNAFLNGNKKLPVYNYDLFEISDQDVVYDTATNEFYALPNQAIDEQVTLYDKARWFFRQNETENITSNGNQFSIGGQWYYVNEVELVKYVSEYAKAYKNDLSLLPHSENDINRNNLNNTNLIYCVEECADKSKSYRKVRLTNVNIPLIAYEELTGVIDSNSSYSGNIPIVLKGTVDFKVDKNVEKFDVINIYNVKNNTTVVSVKQLHILKGTKKGCTLWGAFDMNSASEIGSLRRYKVNFNKTLVLDRNLNEIVVTGRWNKILDVVVVSGQSTVQQSTITGLNVTENGNPLNVKLEDKPDELQTNLAPMKSNVNNNMDNSILMAHYTYDVNLYNSKGNTNSFVLPQFVAKLNRFVSSDNKKVYGIKLQSTIACTKEFGNYGNVVV